MAQHIISGEITSDTEVYLVTGSHGHIGSYIVEQLCLDKDNITIVCVDSLYYGHIDNLKAAFSAADHKVKIVRGCCIPAIVIGLAFPIISNT